MENDYLFVEKKDAIATLFINRPEKRNALNLEMWSNLPKILRELDEADDVKVLVIRGIDETAFAAGADISEFTSLRSTAVGEQKYNKVVAQAEAAIANFSKPTISMIQKYCIGGGCVIALACDLRFSSETGIFAVTPSKIGIIYSFAGTKHLVDLVGPSRAKDILFSGRELSVYEAYSYGLIDRIIMDEEIVEKTYEYAEILSKRAQKTIKGAKKMIHEIQNGAKTETEEIRQLTVNSYASTD
ncbi:MAG TPA: hypothetical protein DDZ89_13240, partial [Clostridiales bacterium]|nr:hypothetical protein [Clostridiales bacterium]